MTLPFKQIPANLRLPGFYAELDPSKANSAAQNQRTLIIGQITSAGAAAPNVPLKSNGAADAITQGGAGSMLALMTSIYRQNDAFGEVWYLPLADAAGAVAASGSVAFTGPATAAGTLALYVAGTNLAVAVTSGMTANALATAVAAAVTASPNLPVTATATTSTVTITAKNAGLAGNDIDLRLNYQTSAGGEVTPAGIAATITAMTGGATNPTLTTALAALANKSFDFIITPYVDATSIGALSGVLSDAGGRWSWNSALYGHVFGAIRGTSGALTTFGLTLNDQHTTFMGFYDSPTPNWLWAAAFGAAAVSLRADPGTPLQTLTLQGVLAPPIQSRFLAGVRNGLLFDGISTFTVTSGVVAIENLITTYQLNAQGVADNSYLEVETMFVLAYVLRDLAAFVAGSYGRIKLAADGTRFAPGSNITTPSIVRADIIARYQQLEYQGYVQQSAAFAAGLTVQQNANNPGRLDVLYGPILIQQLRTMAFLIQFRNF
ncbi:MAG: phage tail sheath subtilisin-like domain-containing protein [Caulobacteraceae bacterium]|nr:phage tail sheath subtilisin-like domain-containing protein [Caulobacteraceae bacterium]